MSTQETAEPCQVSPAELVDYLGFSTQVFTLLRGIGTRSRPTRDADYDRVESRKRNRGNLFLSFINSTVDRWTNKDC